MSRVIPKQVRLPLSRAGEIAIKSLRVRLGRSILTLVTITMAIAFLSYIWITREAETTIAAAQTAAAPMTTAVPAAGPSSQTAGITPPPSPPPASPAAPAGSGARTVWLLSLSLLVCLVGISNAMLMSVMERFREIGTMKCLGALDSFILKMFFLESIFLGAVGAAAGVIVGTLLSLFFLGRRFGAAAWVHMPWAGIWAIDGASVAIGLAITAAAALYPAFKAARMEPIAAMRVEV